MRLAWTLLLLVTAACGKKGAPPSAPSRPIPQLTGITWTGELEIELQLRLPSRDEGGGRFGIHMTAVSGFIESVPPPDYLGVSVMTRAEPGDEFVLMDSTHKVEAAAPGRWPLCVSHRYGDEEASVRVADLVVEIPLQGPPEPHMLGVTSPAPGTVQVRALIPGGETRSLSRTDTTIRGGAREIRFYVTAGLVKGQKLKLRETNSTLKLEDAGRWMVSLHFASVDLGANDDLKAPARDAFRELARVELVLAE